MTERLYYHDAYRTSFEATVVSCAPADAHFAVVLSETAFYPTSGGQPFDVGMLNDARVLGVEAPDDEVIHVVDRALPVGARVTGTVDWTRRFDHMQQHTGQHVLSAAFDRLFGNRTESFHLGRESSSIDLAREVSAKEIRAAEEESNRVVWEDRPVHIRFVDAEEAAALPLRKASERSGALRLIDIEAFDLSACGGTHVARTGGVGVIAVAGWERFKGGSRVEFVCGGRALERFREWREAFAATTRLLSVPPADLGAAIEKLQAEGRQLQKTLRTQQEQLARHESHALAARAETAGPRRILVEAVEGWDASGLKTLATAAVAQEPSLVVALVAGGEAPVAVIAAGAAAGVDAAAVLKGLTAQFGGRGGGRRDLAQGGGFSARADALVAAARTLIARS
jgi:alanyl-tRNA synthetase